VSSAVREAVRALDGRWARLWLRGGNAPVTGIIRVKVDGSAFLLERPGHATLPQEFAAVVLWAALDLPPAPLSVEEIPRP
jgi:hypothetical protein